MNYVKQAYELSSVKKQSALATYKQATTEFVNKNYLPQCDDPHVELGATFGLIWLMTQRSSGSFWKDAALYAEANVAFNYANLELGIRGKFITTAKELVSSSERISDKELKRIAKQMDCLMRGTSVEEIKSNFALTY